MTTPRRWSFGLVLRQLAGAQSTLRRADTRHGSTEAMYLAQLQRAQLAIADAMRRVRAMRRARVEKALVGRNIERT